MTESNPPRDPDAPPADGVLAPLPDRAIDDEAAARILERASQLDVQRGPAVSLSQLREIALEVGISAEAFDRAVAEVGTSPTAAPPDATTIAGSEPDPGRTSGRRGWLGRLWEVVRPTITMFAGFAVGFSGASSDAFHPEWPYFDSGSTFAFVVVAMASVVLGLLHRAFGSRRSFQIDLAVLWVGFCGGLLVGFPGAADDGIFLSLLAWMVLAAAGFFAVRQKTRNGDDEKGKERSDPELITT